MNSKSNKLGQLKSQIGFLYNSLNSNIENIKSIWDDIKNDQKLIETSIGSCSICKDKVIYEFIQKRLKHINKQVKLENEYINLKMKQDIDFINQTKQARFANFMSQCFDDIYSLFGLNSYDFDKSSGVKNYNSGGMIP